MGPLNAKFVDTQSQSPEWSVGVRAADCPGKAIWGCIGVGATKNMYDREGAISGVFLNQTRALTCRDGTDMGALEWGNWGACLSQTKAPTLMEGLGWSKQQCPPLPGTGKTWSLGVIAGQASHSIHLQVSDQEEATSGCAITPTRT